MFADRRNIQKLRNEVISVLTFECHRSQLMYSPLAIATGFANLPEESHLLELIVHEHATHGTPLRGGKVQ